MNPGGGGCSELRSCHFISAWATRVKLHVKKKEGKTDAGDCLPVVYLCVFHGGDDFQRSLPFSLMSLLSSFKLSACGTHDKSGLLA